MTLQRVTALPPPPVRPQDSHKGTFGRVLIVAGSPGMAGAAALSGLGALRGGAGLVYIAVPASIANTVSSVEPSYLTLPLPIDSEGRTTTSVIDVVMDALDGMNVCAVGPGLGTSDVAQQLVQKLYHDASLPVVIDADGLNCLVQAKVNFTSANGPRVLTPHPGEFARLISSDTKTVQSNREALAVRFADESKSILVLKGHQTIVTDGHRVYTNTTGNSGMATGGTGDVLTGLLSALLAQHMDPFEAAQLAVFLHGRAGDLAAEALSEPGLIASDLPRFLGPAWKSLQSGS